MLAEPYLVDEVEVGVEDFVGSVAIEHTEQERDDAFNDHGVGVGLEGDGAILVAVGGDPHAALASFDEVCRRFLVIGKRRKSVAQVDDVGIAVHPVAETLKLFNDFVLRLVDSHNIDVWFAVERCFGEIASLIFHANVSKIVKKIKYKMRVRKKFALQIKKY